MNILTSAHIASLRNHIATRGYLVDRETLREEIARTRRRVQRNQKPLNFVDKDIREWFKIEGLDLEEWQ